MMIGVCKQATDDFAKKDLIISESLSKESRKIQQCLSKHKNEMIVTNVTCDRMESKVT